MSEQGGYARLVASGGKDMTLERTDGDGPIQSGDVVKLRPLSEGEKESVTVGELESGIYISVVISAFGGVTQELSGGSSKDEKSLEIHPLIMLLLSFPLFVAQMSIIMMLRLDQDLTVPVYEPLNATQHAWYELTHGHTQQSLPISDLTRVTGVTLLKAKLLMLLILQLIFFGRLQNTARMLAFLLNPTTWHQIKRTSAERAKTRFKGQCGIVYSAYLLSPITCIAVTMKLIVAYNVLVDSASIILSSEGVKHAIFNSLAVSFIGELNSFWWYLCSKILHLNPIDSFEFEMADEGLRKDLEKNSLWKFIEQKFPKVQCLYRGKGGNRIEHSVVAFMIFLLYFRQFGILLQALDTNILPMSRDVCTFYRWQNYEYQNWVDIIGANTFVWLESFLLIDPVRSIQARGSHYCKNGHERNMRYDMIATTAHLMNSYPKTWWMCVFTIFGALIVPQILFAFNTEIRACVLDKKKDDPESASKS